MALICVKLTRRREKLFIKSPQYIFCSKVHSIMVSEMLLPKKDCPQFIQGYLKYLVFNLESMQFDTVHFLRVNLHKDKTLANGIQGN